jgi:hypothetical protein
VFLAALWLLPLLPTATSMLSAQVLAKRSTTATIAASSMTMLLLDLEQGKNHLSQRQLNGTNFSPVEVHSHHVLLSPVTRSSSSKPEAMLETTSPRKCLP